MAYKKTSGKTATKKQEKPSREKWGVLWRNKSKDGSKTYFSGSLESDGLKIMMFPNHKTKETHPDYRIMTEGENDLEEVASMWVKTSKGGVKYLSGKTKDGLRLVAFATKPEDREKYKCPYFNIYISEDADTPKAGTQKTEDEFVNVPSDEEMPF